MANRLDKLTEMVVIVSGKDALRDILERIYGEDKEFNKKMRILVDWEEQVNKKLEEYR